MRIVELNTQPYELMMKYPLRTSVGTFPVRRGWVLTVLDSDGVCGYGEAAPLPGFSVESIEEVRGQLAELKLDSAGVLGETVAGLVDVRSVCAGRELWPSVRHALEQALVDLVARRQGISCAFLLSARVRQSIPTTRLVHDTQAAAVAVRDGVASLKVKVGWRSIEQDVAHVAAIREEVGKAVRLRLDVNGVWSFDMARRALDLLADKSIECVEQPVGAHAFESLRRLRECSPIAVAVDESVRSESDLQRIIEEEAADVVVVKPMLCGGPLIALDMLYCAHEAGLRTYVTTSFDAAIGRHGAVAVAAAAPEQTSLAAGLDTGRLLLEDVAVGPRVARGSAEVTDGPGWGVQVGDVR